MESWGIEVKAGETFKVEVEDFCLLHLHQAALGEVKKGKVDNVPVWLHVDGKKLVMGTLSSERFPQMMLDLVFEKDFELSHGWKDGSVYFFGHIENEGPEDDFDDEFEDDESLSRQKMALLKQLKDSKSPKSGESSEEESSAEEDVDSDEDDDSEDVSEDEKDAKPMKRPAETAAKTPVPAKKQKPGTPQKTDGKKDVHTATPHPSSKLNSKKAKKGGK